MIRICLSDADRERLGAPKTIPFDFETLTNREAMTLQRLGYPSPRIFRKALQIHPLNENGEATKNDDGEAYTFDVDYLAWTALLWLALRRCGINVDVDTLEYDIENLRLLGDDEPETKPPVHGGDDTGKAQEPSQTLAEVS